MNIDFYSVAADFFPPAVKFFFQLRARQDHAGTRDQRFQHGPFARGQRDGVSPLTPGGAIVRINADAGMLEDRFRAAGAAPDQRAHARQQLFHVVGGGGGGA